MPDGDLRDRLSDHEERLKQEAAEVAAKLSRWAGPAERAAFGTAMETLEGSVRTFEHRTGELARRTGFAKHRQRLGRPGPSDPLPTDIDQDYATLARLHECERYWRHLREMLRQMCGPRADGPRPLMPEPRRGTFDWAIAKTMDNHHRGIHRFIAAPGDLQRQVGNPAYFRDIPHTLYGFTVIVLAARRLLLAQGRPAPHRFLDVGCGTGTKVHTAASIFDRVEGLDHDADYVAVTRRLLRTLGRPGCRAFRADAFEFADYGDYDALWFYRPVAEDDMLQDLEAHIVQRMRPGALLLAPYERIHGRHDRIGLVEVEHPIYTTGMTLREVKSLRRRAQRIGMALPVRETDKDRADWGWMLPLVDAARMQGYDLI